MAMSITLDIRLSIASTPEKKKAKRFLVAHCMVVWNLNKYAAATAKICRLELRDFFSIFYRQAMPHFFSRYFFYRRICAVLKIGESAYAFLAPGGTS
ncbi:hypothetical protein CR51_29520 [Caballeronia megalochromosomata]|nr:hypothetical protein CR51_29520 [Caballeronia megalochromosomata]